MAVSESVLSVQGLSARYGERIVLVDIGFEVPARGIVLLVGPVAAGKSTLLRLLSDASYGVAVSDGARLRYCGRPLDELDRPALVAQKARLLLASVLENVVENLPERSTLSLTQQRDVAVRLLCAAGLDELTDRLDDSAVGLDSCLQRRLGILRCVGHNPRLLLVDEPTAGLDEVAAEPVLALLRAEACRRAVLIVTHNQRHARALGGKTVFLAGGRVLEEGPTARFFTSPRTTAGSVFVRTGSCAVPSPNTSPEELDPEFVAERASSAILAGPASKEPTAAAEQAADATEALGPTGFRWLKPGRLAGTPRPGLIRDLEDDLRALRRAGVTVLVNLTEHELEPKPLEDHGMRCLWVPVKDMHAPAHAVARDLCKQVESLISAAEVVAMHCRAGLGRTGTVLAAQLVWEGLGAQEALIAVRKVEPRWVQSESQVRFLRSFAAMLH